MKKNKIIQKELESKLLTDVQAQTVKTMIVKSMENVYLDVGQNPTDNFYKASARIADKILADVQMGLLQGASFDRAIKKSKAFKNKKTK